MRSPSILPAVLQANTTYENPQITAVNMHATDLNGTEVVSYPMLQDTEIRYQN